MMTNNVYDPAAIQHEFTRKALRFFYEDIPEGEYDGSEDDLREYASTINEVFGYDLDKRIAALTAERDALQAENTRLREALKPFAEYAANLTYWDSDPVAVAKWSGIVVTVGDFRKAAAARDNPT